MSGARELIDRYRNDPVAFCRERLRFQPWSAQVSILEALRDHDRVAVKACHASGKTAGASAAVAWWLAGGPGSVAVTTAPTERQVRKVLWREIATRHKASRGLFDGAVLTDTELFIEPGWFAAGFSTDEAEAFQGFHGSRMLVVVDEASGVEQPIFEAIDGALAGGDAKLLLIGNPLRTSGQFFDAFTSERDLWRTITISAADTPNLTGEKVSRELRRRLVSARWVEQAARKWGEGSPLYQVRVEAAFPSQADDAVVALADPEAAQAAELTPEGPLILACDVARFGNDRTVLAVRHGNVVRVVKSYGGKDTMRTVGEITRLARDMEREHGRRPVVVVDDAGLGGGVTDRLRELRELHVVAYTGARKASRPNEYPNRRSEDWFALAELLPQIDLDPRDDELAADLLAPRYALDSQGRRVVEGKSESRRRLRRSPDRGDAVVMSFAVRPSRGQWTTHLPKGRTDTPRPRTYAERHALRRRSRSSADGIGVTDAQLARVGIYARDASHELADLLDRGRSGP